jgi:hypothetical protein
VLGLAGSSLVRSGPKPLPVPPEEAHLGLPAISDEKLEGIMGDNFARVMGPG